MKSNEEVISGEWLKGMGLSGSQVDYIMEHEAHSLEAERQRILERVASLSIENDAHYNMAIDDVKSIIEGEVWTQN
jgi:hypothetical protein